MLCLVMAPGRLPGAGWDHKPKGGSRHQCQPRAACCVLKKAAALMAWIRGGRSPGLLADFEVGHLFERTDHGGVIPGLAAVRDAGVEQLLCRGRVGQ